MPIQRNPTNGILTFLNTTNVFTPVDGGSAMLNPRSLTFYGSAVSQLVMVDADGVTILELGVGVAKTHVSLDGHFFSGIRPWKCPIKCTTLTAGSRVRIYL